MSINLKFSFKLLLIVYSIINIVSACENIIRTGVAFDERAAILDDHNRLRQSVAMGRVSGQPAAADMEEMKWDDELAARAQAWASSCPNGHDEGRHVGRFPVGQNIATSWSSHQASGADPDYTTQIQAWFDEVGKYGIGAPFSTNTGHYSQLVWGDSSLVGCGYANWYESQRGYVKMYVCNYGPGGNIKGYNPYTLGQPNCKQHGMNPSSRYQGLCDRSGSNVQPPPAERVHTHSYKPPAHNYLPQIVYKQPKVQTYKPQIQSQVKKTYSKHPFQNLFTFGKGYHLQNSIFSNFFSK